MSTRVINVDYLARVEGEGALYVKINEDRVEDVKLKIFEPPRFFEAFLRDRRYDEAPDITARICGICPIAYMMGASQAMEMVCGVNVSDPILKDLRRLIYCGEWIESHVLHIYMLHAPDFLGYHDAIAMAKDHKSLVEKGLKLKKIGNDVMKLVGGREIHPVNLKVGGFYKAPSKAAMQAMVEPLQWALQAAKDTVEVVSGLTFPEFERDYEFIALRHPTDYPITEGRLVSSKGLDVDITGYDDYLIEEHDAHSTALRTVTKDGNRVHLGPLARYALNRDRLSDQALQSAESVKAPEVMRNPFMSILARAIEVVYAVDECLRICRNYEEPPMPGIEVTPKAGTGFGATEAPRGICYHRYTIDDEGIIRDAKIVAPTSVNQATVEKDLLAFIPPRIHMSDEELQHDCEQAVRNYDPCISCSAHFLKLTVDRS